MKSTIVFLAGAVTVAACFFGYGWLAKRQNVGQAPAGPALVTKPIFFTGDPQPRPAPAGAALPTQALADSPPTTAVTGRVPAPLPTPLTASPTPPAPAAGEVEHAVLRRSTSGAAEGGPVLVRGASAAESERSLAKAAFDAGDRKRGTRLLEDLFQASKDRADVDLSAEVERLLEVETRLERRREFLQYLTRYDRSGRLVDDQIARAEKRISDANDDASAALAAWDDFTLAYEAASEPLGRRKVVSRLQPFLERFVFSGRYSPLLKTHTVKPGESLFTVAAQYGTTVDAVRRLNALKSEVIQPRQRLRILPGKVQVFVDKSEFRLWATVDGRLLLEFPVGLGVENATPAAAFVIRVRQKDPSWWRQGEGPIPAGDPKNILGSRWLGFQETQDFAGFGIHGTQDPSSVGKESSAGCIRLRNEDVELLYDFIPYGAEVVVRP